MSEYIKCCILSSVNCFTVDTVEEKIRIHVTLKNYNNHDSVEFSGVGGEIKTHLRRYWYFTVGDISPDKLLSLRVYFRAIRPAKTDINSE